VQKAYQPLGKASNIPHSLPHIEILMSNGMIISARITSGNRYIRPQ